MGRTTTITSLAWIALLTWPGAAVALEPAVRASTAEQGGLAAGDDIAGRRGHKEPKDSCRRWRVIASRLGETYAGHRLRATIVARACAFAGADIADADQLWQWPWRDDGRVRSEPPPEIRGAYGDWVIRCGKAGKRQRCAMLSGHAADPSPEPTAPAPRMVSHFVIDTVGGRESVVWRVQVDGVDGERDHLELNVGGKRAVKPFLGCGQSGCLVEADVKLSSEAANILWDGAALSLAVVRDGRTGHIWHLSAAGFQAALRELARLRREEGRALATQR